ncbi:hypothetical protein GCM10010919_02470 [Alishewanella longhuensis]|uniref:Solute-binding protein family 3/N-terminal domain-containing protein n=2 Tax=Alishewanella longhuensis TaxID=1091037 RepID=A0ABQ3KT61_9ALTE|nr:hypothetical protein GCM10010919_02470 [Alishewanella longhuensis]
MQAQHFPPRFIKAADNSWTGYNIELFQALAKELGCSSQFLETPWGRSMQLLASGELDAMSNVSYNEQRAQFAYFIGPHQQERVKLVTNLQPAPSKASLTDLMNSQHLIAAMQGIYYGADFEQALETQPAFRQRLIFVTLNQQKLALFLSGRVQYMLEDQINLQQLYLSDTLDQQQHPALFTLYENPVFFAFSKQRFNHLGQKTLEDAWQQLLAKGIQQELQQKYFAATPTGEN